MKMTVQDLCVRVTLQEGVTQSSVVEYMKEISTGYYYIVRELGKGGDNPHVQSYVQTEKFKNVRSAREAVKRNLKVTGNGMYSVTPIRKTVPAYISYLMKEENHEVLAKMIWPNVLKQAEDLSSEIQAKAKKPKALTVMDRMERDLLPFDTEDKSEYAKKVVLWHIDTGRTVPNRHKLQDIVRTWWIKKDPSRVAEYVQAVSQFGWE